MAELQWALVKKWNRYQVHSGNYVLTSEPGNLYNRPFPQFSGIVHHGALNIQSAKDGKGITVSMKTNGAFTKPQTWKKNGTRSYLKSARKFTNRLSSTLSKAALARISRISRAQRVAAGHLGKAKTAPKPAEAQKQ